MTGTSFDVQCCFCGRRVEAAGLDPCSLTLAPRVEGPFAEAREQDFWCHADCFRRVAHESVPLYILDRRVFE